MMGITAVTTVIILQVGNHREHAVNKLPPTGQRSLLGVGEGRGRGAGLHTDIRLAPSSTSRACRTLCGVKDWEASTLRRLRITSIAMYVPVRPMPALQCIQATPLFSVTCAYKCCGEGNLQYNNPFSIKNGFYTLDIVGSAKQTLI